MRIKKLAENTGNIFRWFDNENRVAYASLAKVINDTYYEKIINELIDDILNETGNVKDTASEELEQIRMSTLADRK